MAVLYGKDAVSILVLSTKRHEKDRENISQASFLLNSWAEFSKTQFFLMSIVKKI